MKRLILGSLAIIVGVVSVAASSLSAQSNNLFGQQLQQVRQNCTGTQLILRQLQKRDAVSRINRGRAYDQLLRQLSALESRLTYNNISLPQLVQTHVDLQGHVELFRTAYIAYDERLGEAIKIDCKQQPNEFYQSIIEARSARDQVGTQVTRLEQSALLYRQELIGYQFSLPASALQDATP
jgi:hypothetical protein